ncbi:putative membrane protein [Nautilia profundicola AmH]|uniref:Membrane protein n=1 Tax=Nautilia profundicola (strain ATCC BAA-1463 / DSM 18972 / AmH) TaxID=598659 RepID=B9L5V3_NAUPA|nr:hypothetical protein [Nautilia profundicola]ACM92094.1 putative membrane protein [Nautilia profundicola AmH]
MRGENFIFFLASCGFFIGIIFSILHSLDFQEFLYATILITAIFYLLGLATVTFFIKYLDIKKVIYFNKHEIDEILDIQIKELEKKEDFILESYEFIKQVEEEELKLLKNKS